MSRAETRDLLETLRDRILPLHAAERQAAKHLEAAVP
jgi:hypothetical protein